MTKTKQEGFTEDLLNWFDHNKRWMPWRETKDPYHIWISEIMLQQTRVDTVIGYFKRFIQKYPRVEDLARAEVDEVLKSWEGLGYYARARNLHLASKIVVEKYHGQVPMDLRNLLSLPGIGEYTAGAILSIAYSQPVPAIDGNVLRVFSRIFNIHKNILDKETKKEIYQLIEELISKQRSGAFNESLMELGAVVCTPKNPKCDACPVQSFCVAYKVGTQEQLPLKEKKTKIKELKKAVLWIEQNDLVLVKKNPNKGLLGGLWTFPTFLLDENPTVKEIKDLEKVAREKGKIAIEIKKHIGKESHIFTHQVWNMEIFQCEWVDTLKQAPSSYRWVSRKELEELAFPSVFRKVQRQVEKKRVALEK